MDQFIREDFINLNRREKATLRTRLSEKIEGLEDIEIGLMCFNEYQMPRLTIEILSKDEKNLRERLSEIFGSSEFDNFVRIDITEELTRAELH